MVRRALPRLLANGSGSVRLEEIYLVTRQLQVLQHSGVPLLSSLRALQAQVESPSMRRILQRVHEDLLEGQPLSQALARHPKAFNPVYVGLIRVGESGGLLSEVLLQLAELLEWEIDVRERIKQALQYPLIVLLVLCGAMGVMAVFVLPRFASLFQSFRIPLPWQTRLLIIISGLLRRYWWFMGLALFGAIGGWWAYLRTDGGRLRWHTWKLRLPILGPVFAKLAMSRFARVTAALAGSGVPILETLTLAGESVNNRYLRAKLEVVRQRVRGGGSLANAMKAEPAFPAIVTQMFATGEETGRLDELLRSVSAFYDQQVAYSVKRLITSLEPLLLVVVSLGVLIVATAVFVPMWDLVKVFKQPGR